MLEEEKPEEPRRPSRRAAEAVVAVLTCLGVSCSAAWHEGRVDRSVYELLDRKQEQVLGEREATLLYPDPAPEPEPEPAVGEAPEEGAASPAETPAPDEPLPLLSLGDALQAAVDHNRDYRTRFERLYLNALALLDTRHTFSTRLSLLLDYTFSGGNAALEQHDALASVGLTKTLPWGGTLGVGAGTGFLDAGGDGTFDTDASITLSQPLLRGAGYEVSHEPLVQGERELIYGIRDFELFREDFSIEVAQRFYDLVGQQRQIKNQKKNLEDLIFDRRRAEALFEVGRASELDVLRNRRDELDSRNTLLEAEERYEQALDRFRIFLGLPVSARFDVRPEAPAFVEVDYDVDSAVEVALANRLDVLNRKGRLEDAERGVRIARNALLPDLDLNLSYTRAAGPESTFSDQEFDGETYSAGIRFDAADDRVLERSSYRRSQIGLAQERRAYEEFVENVVVDVESAFRELARRHESLGIQRELIVDQERNVRIARLRFERGEFSNRDVVEAQESLLDARNELINEQVNYEIARLQLLRDLGILFIDENGMWKE